MQRLCPQKFNEIVANVDSSGAILINTVVMVSVGTAVTDPLIGL